jgi:hypothetical protein
MARTAAGPRKTGDLYCARREARGHGNGGPQLPVEGLTSASSLARPMGPEGSVGVIDPVAASGRARQECWGGKRRRTRADRDPKREGDCLPNREVDRGEAGAWFRRVSRSCANGCAPASSTGHGGVAHVRYEVGDEGERPLVTYVQTSQAAPVGEVRRREERREDPPGRSMVHPGNGGRVDARRRSGIAVPRRTGPDLTEGAGALLRVVVTVSPVSLDPLATVVRAAQWSCSSPA